MLVLAAAITLTACSRNPDPEYAPDDGDAPAPAPAEVASRAEVASPAEAAPPAVAATALSEEEAMRRGREAVQLLFDGDMAALWPRFDAAVQAQAGSAENFGEMVGQIFDQIGAEMNVVEEEVLNPAAQPGLSVYRRRSTYLGLGADADLYVAFNADGTIGGINIRPAE